MDEHEELWKRYRAGDREAYEALAEAYLPLVKVTVGRAAMNIPSYISREELCSAGAMGLISAIERYDPSRAAKFTTYAITRIRGAILDELRSHDLLGRVTRERVSRIRNAENELHNSGGKLTPEVIAVEAGLTIKEYWDAELGALAAKQISLSGPVEDGEHSLADLIVQREDDSLGSSLEIEEIMQVVEEMLTEKEKTIVVLYYTESLTLKEVGEIIKVSESRVSQIHTAMVTRIRKKLEKMGILF